MIGTDIKFYGSGASNLGGAIGSLLTSNSLHNLFDAVSEAEAVTGSTEYRCIYVKNTHGTDTLQGAKIWIDVNTTSADSTLEIALGDSALSGTESSIADETTDPGLTDAFSATATEGAAKVITDMAAGVHKAIWIKRIVLNNSGAESGATATLKVSGIG